MKPPSKVSWYRFVAVAVLLSCIAGCTVFREKQRISECRDTKADGGSIAIRLNLLGALNLDVIGDVEYALPSGLGFLLGGGIQSPIVNMWGPWFQNSKGVTKALGMYVGARIPIDIGDLNGLGLKPMIVYSTQVLSDTSDIIPPIPQDISFVTHRIGGYLGVAYTKVFARKWIVEPVIAIGPTLNSLNIAPSKFRFSHISMPLQLNVGFRF
jgi:hypothetical protein